MALMDAQEYDPRPAQRRRRLILIAAPLIIIAVVVWYWYFYMYCGPARHVIDDFFTAIEHRDFETAYGIYHADPDWKQHLDKYSGYTLGQFERDWGPSGDYGIIKTHRIDCAKIPDLKEFRSPTGTIVVVSINGLPDEPSLWVENKPKTITISPYPVQCHPPR